MPICTHLDTVNVTQLPYEVDGCEDCLAIGGLWLHLRICLECGHVGCCDDSPNRHATAHHRATTSRARRGSRRRRCSVRCGLYTWTARRLRASKRAICPPRELRCSAPV